MDSAKRQTSPGPTLEREKDSLLSVDWERRRATPSPDWIDHIALSQGSCADSRMSGRGDRSRSSTSNRPATEGWASEGGLDKNKKDGCAGDEWLDFGGMAQAFDRQGKAAPDVVRGCGRDRRAFGLIIPCRVASPQSPALFHQARRSLPKPTNAEKPGRRAIDPASWRRPKKKM
jgi:hypothetical protein